MMYSDFTEFNRNYWLIEILQTFYLVHSEFEFEKIIFHSAKRLNQCPWHCGGRGVGWFWKIWKYKGRSFNTSLESFQLPQNSFWTLFTIIIIHTSKLFQTVKIGYFEDYFIVLLILHWRIQIIFIADNNFRLQKIWEGRTLSTIS